MDQRPLPPHLTQIYNNVCNFIRDNEGVANQASPWFLGRAVFHGSAKKTKGFGVELAGVNCLTQHAEDLAFFAKQADFNQQETSFLVGAAKLKDDAAEQYLAAQNPRFSVSYEKAEKLFKAALVPKVTQAEDEVNKYLGQNYKDGFPTLFIALPTDILTVLIDSKFLIGNLGQYADLLINYSSDRRLRMDLIKHFKDAIKFDNASKERTTRKIELLEGHL